MNLTEHEQKLLLRALDKASSPAEAEKAAEALINSLRKRGINGYEFLKQSCSQPQQQQRQYQPSPQPPPFRPQQPPPQRPPPALRVLGRLFVLGLLLFVVAARLNTVTVPGAAPGVGAAENTAPTPFQSTEPVTKSGPDVATPKEVLLRTKPHWKP
jgi:hypothetical protein